MTEETKQETKGNLSLGKLHDKYYKFLLVLPALAIIVSLVFLVSFYYEHDDVILKDVSLTGGATITVEGSVDMGELNAFLSERLDDFSAREISDLRTGEQIAFVVQTPDEVDVLKPFLEEFLGYGLTDENSSIEFTGSSLSAAFYTQLRFAILLAFVLMAVVVFLIFRSFVPGFAVVFSAFADIVITLAIVNFLGWKMSSAGIVAFLMLIGYSVDTDIMLTSRLLKRREESVNERLFSAFKTGITMTLTSIAAVSVALIMIADFSETLKQIFSILTIGLVVDIFITWVANAGILKWHVTKEGR